ncbi:MAG TPA: hypothetical protein VF290_07810 [Pyrinomonadaceae bacterium]
MFRVAISLALLLLTIATRAQETPSDNPFTTGPPVKETRLSGAIVTTINNGDFVHPTFSPDGKVLAYSNVLVKGDFENTEVFLHNLDTNKRSILLNSRKAATYATYKAFVSEMKWTRAKRLEVSIGDGDVDSTKLIFDPQRRRLLTEQFEGGDEFEARPLSRVEQKAYEQARSLFPSFPREVLDNALRTTALVIPDQGIILQKNYAGHDFNIWFLDFQNKSVKALINLPDRSINAFNGGVAFKSAIVLAVSDGTKTYLFLYRAGKISRSGEFNSGGFGFIEVKHVSSLKVIFLLRTHGMSDRGDNPLFVFDGIQLLRINDHSELYDAAVDPAGRRIAYCYWAGDKRHIVVKEFK